MTPTSLSPSPPDRRPLWRDAGDEPEPPQGAAPTPPPTRRRRVPLAVLLATSALIGGATSAGVLIATGVAGDGSGTTVIQRQVGGGNVPASVASAGGLDAASLYDATSAGVVDITVRTSSGNPAPTPFGGVPPQQQQGTASGTGFVIDKQGHIVTAAHVVDNATSVTVKLADGTTRKATVLGKDDATDIAVIRIDPSGLTLQPLKLGSSASLDVGAEVAAIGDPFGYDRSISTGIVSGVDRTIQAPNGFTVSHAIQIDAAINPGNSGGPVLDAGGNVIGIADQIATDGNAEQSSGVGFAVPIDLVKSTVKTLAAGGKVEHAYIGIETADSTSTTPGAVVGGLTNGGPAATAGLRTGDVITQFDGQDVGDSNALVGAIAGHKPGDKVELTVKRGNDTVHLKVTLGTQPAQSPNAGG